MKATTKLFLWIVVLLFDGMICEPSDTTDFFPNIKDNLTRVTWMHAVNNASYLEEVLKSEIMMIEADVIMGKLIDDKNETLQPVMGHPPAVYSDISLKQFLNRISDSNNNEQRTIKGVKLDFKSIEVFEQSLSIIDSLYHTVEYPVWINADILEGPIDSQVVPVDPERFLKGSSPYQTVMLSIGWTTKYGADQKGSYTDEQITKMLQAVKDNEVTQVLTFPVRAGLAAESFEQMRRLLQESSSDSTLTIWSSAGDYVDIEKLKALIFASGLDRIYLDVPKSLSDELHL